MKKSLNIFWLLLIITFQSKAQSTQDSVLSIIVSNNKTLGANEQYWEAKKMEYQTGLTPNNPKVDYDYLKGSPVGAGNQTDFTVTQSFDFPSAYNKKKQLSTEKSKQAEFQMVSMRQDVLLEAKQICINLVYRNKLQLEISKRKGDTEKWLADFQKKLDKGDGNILDINKAKLQLIQINARFQENKSEINLLNQKLTALNGGVLINFLDTVYSEKISLPSFEALETEIEENDPIRKYLEQESIIGQKQIDLSKAMALPKIETGYHYQALLGQRFNGIHFGVTLPLWENRNSVKSDQVKLLSTEMNIEEHRNEHYYHIQQVYDQQQNISVTLSVYETFFSDSTNGELLDKSLKLGHISTLEYFMEKAYYFEALENYFQLENEYYLLVAELYKYKL